MPRRKAPWFRLLARPGAAVRSNSRRGRVDLDDEIRGVFEIAHFGAILMETGQAEGRIRARLSVKTRPDRRPTKPRSEE
jgi:hypothetical protein